MSTKKKLIFLVIVPAVLTFVLGAICLGVAMATMPPPGPDGETPPPEGPLAGIIGASCCLSVGSGVWLLIGVPAFFLTRKSAMNPMSVDGSGVEVQVQATPPAPPPTPPAPEPAPERSFESAAASSRRGGSATGWATEFEASPSMTVGEFSRRFQETYGVRIRVHRGFSRGSYASDGMSLRENLGQGASPTWRFSLHGNLKVGTAEERIAGAIGCGVQFADDAGRLHDNERTLGSLVG